MGHIFLKTNELSFTGYAIYRVVENSAPTVEITRQSFAPPHPERGVTFSPLRPVMHQVQLWESVDGVALGTLRATIDIDASINNELQVTFFDIVVDRGNPGLVTGDTGDPVAGTNQYLDARMFGQTYSIVQRSLGPRRPEDEYTDETTHGGFTLPGAEVFNSEDTFFITIWAATQVIEPLTANDFDVIIAPNDLTIDSAYFGKLVVATGVGTIAILTLPLFSTIPDKTRISFSTQYGNYTYLQLQLQTGDSIQFIGALRNSIFLARSERIDLIWKGGVAYIISYDGRARLRGGLYGDYMPRVGTVVANGNEYQSGELAGLWDWLINDAPSNIKTTYALWNTSTDIDGVTVFPYKGLFAMDLTGLTVKVPDVSGMFERYLLTGDAERTPNNAGGFQAMLTKNKFRYTTGTGGPDEGDNLTGVGYQGGSPGIAQFKYRYLTEGAETRGENIGKLPLIIL